MGTNAIETTAEAAGVDLEHESDQQRAARERAAENERQERLVKERTAALSSTLYKSENALPALLDQLREAYDDKDKELVTAFARAIARQLSVAHAAYKEYRALGERFYFSVRYDLDD